MASTKQPLSGGSMAISPARVQPSVSITSEVTVFLSALREVEITKGKDARKARKLVLASRVFLRKLGEQNPAVGLILQGRKIL